MKLRQFTLTAAAALLMGMSAAHAATEITFWHAMEGPLGVKLNQIVDAFNKQNPQYHVDAVYKGTYAEAMNAGIAAFRAGNAPDILQVFEVGTATMMSAKGAIVPVQEMSEKAGDPIDPKDFIGAVAGYYSSNDGKLVSMPFNSSTVVLYYNKDAFQKAGLDPNKPPKTWDELEADGKKLKAAGMECAYTTGWPAWAQLETFAAWHNIPYATLNNGFGGTGARLEITSPLFERHITDLANYAKEGVFTYGGRGDNPNALFVNGKCAMETGSSGMRANAIQNAKFKFGIAPLPYYADVKGAPQNTIIGGASLWVFSHKSADEYKGITKFFKYLSSPQVMADWHQSTGYVPITKAAYQLTKQQGFYDKNPGTEVAVQELNADTTTQSRGVRLGYLPQIRDIEEGQMELIFGGKETPAQGLKNAQEQGDALLAKFQQATK